MGVNIQCGPCTMKKTIDFGAQLGEFKPTLANFYIYFLQQVDSKTHFPHL